MTVYEIFFIIQLKLCYKTQYGFVDYRDNEQSPSNLQDFDQIFEIPTYRTMLIKLIWSQLWLEL